MLIIELPGIEAQDIHIDVCEQVLTISATGFIAPAPRRNGSPFRPWLRTIRRPVTRRYGLTLRLSEVIDVRDVQCMTPIPDDAFYLKIPARILHPIP